MTQGFREPAESWVHHNFWRLRASQTTAMAPQTIITHPTQRTAEKRDRGERKTRAAGGPQDSAHYRCACGHHFAGSVSTHVACPRCGTDQAW